MTLPLLPTSLVGSYAQPDWLIDRKNLAGRFPPRVRARETVARRAGISRPGAGRRDLARDPRPGARRPRHHHRRRDAPRKLFQPLRHGARRRRHRQPRHRARPLRPSQSGAARRRQGAAQASGRGRRREIPARQHRRTIKITVPGPFTMSQQAQNDFYQDEEEMALDYAAAVNAEIKDLFAAGADIVQIDEPYMQARPEKARKYGLKALQRRARRRQRQPPRCNLFRLCGGDPRAAGGLFVPAGVRQFAGPAGVDRDRAVRASTARCWRSCPARPSSSACSICPT